MGNPYVTDDAIGVRLARDFKARHGSDPRCDIVEECSVGGLNLLDLISGYDRLIVLDSIKTKGGVPGTWYRFDATSLRETMNLTGLHDTNFATALEVGRRMGMKIPPDRQNLIFAVEILDNRTFSEKMTAELESAYPVIAEQIFAEIEAILGSES